MFNNRKHIGISTGFNSGNGLSPKRSGATPIYHSATALHEWYRPSYTDVGTTITEVDTGSVGGMDMANPDVASEPTLSANTIDFNGTTQYTRKLTSNFRGSDASGVIHIKVSFTNDNNPHLLFGAGNSSSDLNWFYFQTTYVGGINYVQVNQRKGATIGLKRGNMAVTNGDHVISFASDGSSLHFWIDGVKETTYSVDSIGTNYWFNQLYTAGVTSNGISSGAILRPTPTLSVSSQYYKSYEPWVNDATVSSKALEILNNAV